MSLEETKRYYDKGYIKYLISQNCQHREVFLRGFEHNYHIRPLKIFTMEGMDYTLDRFDFAKRKYHFFQSIAILNGARMEAPPNNLGKMSVYRKRFNEAFPSLLEGIDFVIDIDNDLIRLKYHNAWGVKRVVQRIEILRAIEQKEHINRVKAKWLLEEMIKREEAIELSPKQNLEKSHKIATAIKKIYDKLRLPYYIVFSGKKGFHIRLDWNDFPSYFKVVEKGVWMQQQKTIAQKIAKETDTTYGEDLDAIYDLRRVIRVPYSIHPITENVVLPLDDEQFKDFSNLDFSIDSVFKTVHLKNRTLQKHLGHEYPLWQDFFKKFLRKGFGKRT